MSVKDYLRSEGIDGPNRGVTWPPDERGVQRYIPTGHYTKAKGAEFVCSSAFRAEVLYAQEGRCYICGVQEWQTKERLHMHRVIPGSQGGKYTAENVVGLCRKCHSRVEGKTRAQIDAFKAAGGVK